MPQECTGRGKNNSKDLEKFNELRYCLITISNLRRRFEPIIIGIRDECGGVKQSIVPSNQGLSAVNLVVVG